MHFHFEWNCRTVFEQLSLGNWKLKTHGFVPSGRFQVEMSGAKKSPRSKQYPTSPTTNKTWDLGVVNVRQQYQRRRFRTLAADLHFNLDRFGFVFVLSHFIVFHKRM